MVTELPVQSRLTLFLYNHNLVEKYFRKQENVGVKLKRCKKIKLLEAYLLFQWGRRISTLRTSTVGSIFLRLTDPGTVFWRILHSYFWGVKVQSERKSHLGSTVVQTLLIGLKSPALKRQITGEKLCKRLNACICKALVNMSEFMPLLKKGVFSLHPNYFIS